MYLHVSYCVKFTDPYLIDVPSPSICDNPKYLYIDSIEQQLIDTSIEPRPGITDIVLLVHYVPHKTEAKWGEM